MSVALKKKKEEYQKIVEGHEFIYVKRNKKLPVGQYFWCEFCGGRGRISHTIKRDDGKELLVGTTCLKRVGLKPHEPEVVASPEPKVESAPVDPAPPVSEPQEPEPPKQEAAPKKDDMSEDELDAIFDEAEK